MRLDILERVKATGKRFKIFTDVVEDKALTQFAECMELPSVVEGALMADTHAGYVAPIGSVLLTDGTIFPSFVGYDIGCGMSSITYDNLSTHDVSKEDWESIKEGILKEVPIGFSRHTKPQVLPSTVTNLPMTKFASSILMDIGTMQLGSLGGGNHFLEIGYTDDNRISVVIHSGSRGVGHKIATHYMKEAAIVNTDEDRYVKEFHSKNTKWRLSGKGLDKYEEAMKEFVYRRVRARVSNIEDAYPLDVTCTTGVDYINDMNVALEFALANRKQMIDKVTTVITKVVGKELVTSRLINRNHNHAELTSLGWVHRKGATQAEDGMLGVIPGNMVDGSFIVKGKGCRDSINSSSHGAGRVLSRRKAKDTLSLDEFNECTKHLIANHSDSNLDEAPKAYKNIHEVMANQTDLVEVLDRVIPILNIKG